MVRHSRCVSSRKVVHHLLPDNVGVVQQSDGAINHSINSRTDTLSIMRLGGQAAAPAGGLRRNQHRRRCPAAAGLRMRPGVHAHCSMA
jgi:hypothetical protein